MIITNTNPGNLVVDGVYLNQTSGSPSIPLGPQTGLLGIVGTANYGKVSAPVPFSASSDLQSNFGNGSALGNSLVLAALNAMPECAQFLGVRVTDGTDVAATIAIKDGSSGTVATLTSVYTGSYPNVAASARADLKSGTMIAGPVVRLQIFFPNASVETFDNIIAYAAAGGAYDAPTFKANLLAAINGTISGKVGSARWTATSGASIAAPQTATVWSASGGTDGASGVASSNLIGTDGTTGRTGIYALRGQVQAGGLLVAGLTDATMGATLVSFAQSENCIAFLAFPQGTSSDSAVSAKQTNNLSSPSLVLTMDWDFYFDTIAGVQKYVPPSAKIAGLVASLPAFQYPGNKPVGGVAGIIGTERTASPLSVAEAGERESNGLLYLTNQPVLFNRGTGYGLPHGMTSDGATTIADVRMLKMISWEVQAILGPLVGEMQGTSATDPFRRAVRDRLDGYFSTLKFGTPQQINDYKVVDDLSNNSTTTIAQGLNIASINVQTLSAARFLLAFLQVGSTVQVVTSKAG